ncbi:hypothetical protein BSL78_19346 [Apostichopus japonicus]|uniref:Uncharacterized protein n=1 Tax=Stichopus japonicus TaxID=307972 RepID=A0A2G8K729_STIJA|nr:hypothetical protein BSL78_19346 [Apostichopus japonicus]
MCTVSEAGTGTAATTPVATLAAYERSGHKRARWPVFPHELQTISPLHSARVCPTCKHGYTACSGTTCLMPFQPTPLTSARLARYAMWALCPLAHKVEGISNLSSILTRLVEFDSNSSSPGLDTFTFEEFRLLVAVTFPKRPVSAQQPVQTCPEGDGGLSPTPTVIRCDSSVPQLPPNMDASDAGSLRGKPYIKTIHTRRGLR